MEWIVGAIQALGSNPYINFLVLIAVVVFGISYIRGERARDKANEGDAAESLSQAADRIAARFEADNQRLRDDLDKALDRVTALEKAHTEDVSRIQGLEDALVTRDETIKILSEKLQKANVTIIELQRRMGKEKKS